MPRLSGRLTVQATLPATVAVRGGRGKAAGGVALTPIDVALFIGDSQRLGSAIPDPENLTGFVSDPLMLCWNGQAQFGGQGLTQYVPNTNPGYTPAAGKTGVSGAVPNGYWAAEAYWLKAYRAARPATPVAIFKSANGGSTAAYYGAAQSWDVSQGDRWPLLVAEYALFLAALAGAGYAPTIREVHIQLGQNDAAQATSPTLFLPAITGLRAAIKGLAHVAADATFTFGKPVGNGAYLSSVRDDIAAFAVAHPDTTWLDTDGYGLSGTSHWTAAAQMSAGTELYSLTHTAEAQEEKIIRVLEGRIRRWWDAGHGVTITGQGVSEWADRVAAAVAVQTTDANRPTYSLTDFADGPSLSFDGTNDQMTLANPAGLINGTDPSWSWAVAQQDVAAADTTTRTVAGYRNGANDNNARKLTRTVVSGVNRGEVRSGSGAAIIFARDTQVDLTGKHVMLGKHGAASSQISVDGQPDISANGAMNTMAPTILFIGSSGGSQSWQGKIRDYLVTDPLGASLEAALRTFLGSRAGLTL